jgi:ribosomal protein S4
MNWDKLKEGFCPKCGGMLSNVQPIMECEWGDFTIKKEKYLDLIKGKESTAYKKKKKEWEKIKRYKLKKKEKQQKSAELQNKEKLFNLNRMLEKGEITKEQYELKV